ncbi:MAG: flavodoxin family protein [Spirochaetales bacterium]|nr:flavodoxin family protein [Spirochaetales bacterium]
MTIGIIVYSQTGHTREVAEKLREKLIASGHNAVIDPVIPEGAVEPGAKNVRFQAKPDTDGYEGLVLASPVQAFSLAAAMKAYLPHLGSLKGKKVACLLTKQLKGSWTGANKAFRSLRKAVEEKGGIVAGNGYIVWSAEDREDRITDTVEKLAALF